MNCQRRLKRAIGFSLAAVLLSAVVHTRRAGAQCAADSTNTACGTSALLHNAGANNSAFGSFSLSSNTTGNFNTGIGEEALSNNTTGSFNTATGAQSLGAHGSGGFDNTADGAAALGFNGTGHDNTASGFQALVNNSTGFFNTADGDAALQNNTVGNANTAVGTAALSGNTTGFNNISIGDAAGENIAAGSNNIEIGVSGAADESNTIRIGAPGAQTKAFIAGISSNTQVNGNVVEIGSDGQLGIRKSAARYKRDVHDMGSASTGLMRLRPVTFRYKADPSGTLQYGLIAEEVARVFPELVTRGSDGKLESVQYLEFTALILNELQGQAKQLRNQASRARELAHQLEMKDRQLAAQQREINALKQQNASINGLSERLAALEQQAQTAHPQLTHLANK